ncbi:helix-turn-helix transcriptional regulator [Luteipulveratus mongoliensis]|uniref:helix-turn-helix transcriptional regulator n=1 Tax=Luteipulveratus mongoliensis TaxID=571913 RepID=UPI000697F2EB|nr:helix-turn-helix transcriptional regulator [Luteipulveratus mongoliensis]
MAIKRTRLAQERKAAGLSQERLAEILGVDRSTIGRWETGITEPQPSLRPKLAEALSVSISDLRAMLNGREGTAAPDPVGGVELTDTFSSRASGSEALVLVDARRHYERMYRTSGGLPAKVQLERFLNEHAAPLLNGGINNRPDVLGAMGSLVALAGICAYDCEFYGAAQRHFDHALKLADSSGDRRFGAYVYALMVNQSLALKDFRQAIDHVEAATTYAAGQISPALGADLRAMQSNAHAYMGERQPAYAAISQAESAAARIRYDEEPPETSYIQTGLIEAKLGEALINLGDLDPAFDYAQKSLDADDHPRGRVNRLASMATLELKARDIEHASTLTIEMVRNAEGMESRRLHSRFRELRIGLNNSRASVGSDAVDRLDRVLNIFPW